MSNFESHVGRLLAERAAAIDVHPDEDAVRVDSDGIVQVATRRRPGRSAWLMAAAATFIVVGAMGWATQRATNDAPAETAATDVKLAVALPVLLESLHQPATGILIVWMEPAADAQSIAAVEAALANSGLIDDLEYVDHDETYAEFQAYFADEPEVVAGVAPDDLPTSFRVETDLPDQVAADVRLLPGVSAVDSTLIEADE